MPVPLPIGSCLEDLFDLLVGEAVVLDHDALRRIRLEAAGRGPLKTAPVSRLHESPGLVISARVDAAKPGWVTLEFGGDYDRFAPIELRTQAWWQEKQARLERDQAWRERNRAAIERASASIAAAHDADPQRLPDGRAAEAVYADRMVAWRDWMGGGDSPLLELALRCQHLERFLVPRGTFPEGRTGYLQWRRHLYSRQAERARGILLAAGIAAEDAAQVASWVAKENLGADANAQALEDAAVLVFLENEIEAFAARHEDYPREKWIRILQKSWAKLSPRARRAAAALDYPPGIAELVREAVR